MGGNAYDWFNTDTGGSDSAPPSIGNDGPPLPGGNAYDWFNADTPSSGDQTRAETAIGNDGPPPDSATFSDTSQTDTTKKKQQEEYSAPQIGNDGAPSMATAQQDYGDQTTWTPTEANAYSSEKVAEHAVDRAQQTQSPDDVTFARSTIDDAQKYGAAEQQRFQTLASDEGNVNQAYNTAYADAQQKRAAAGGEYGANLLAGTSPGLSQPILDAGEQSFTTPSGQPVVRKSGDGYDTWTIAGADDPSNVLYQDERGAWSAISRDTAQQLAAQGVPGARFASVANADSIAGNAVASTGEQPSWGRGIQSGLFALSALALPINPGDAALAGLTDTVGEGLTAANTAIPGIGFGGAVKANGVQAVANMLLNGLPEHIPGSNIPIPEFAQHPLAMFLDNPTGVVDTMRKVVEGMMNPQAPAVASLEQDVQDAFTQSNVDYWRQRGLQDAGVGALLVGGLGLHQQDGGLLHFIGADPHSTVARYQTAFQQALDGGKTPEEAATLGTQSVEDTLGNLLWAWNPYNPAYTQLTFPGLEGAVNTVIGRAGRPVEALGTEFAATPAVTDTLLSRADVVAQSLSRNPFALAAPNAAEKITQMVADRLPFAAADQAYPLAQDLYGLAMKIDEDALAAGASTTSSRLSLSQGTRVLAQQFAEKWPGLTDGAALSLAGSIRDGFATAIPAAGKLAARDLGQVTTGTVAKALENRLVEMAGYTLSSPDVKEYLYRTGSSVAQVDGQRFIQGAIKDAITQDLRRYYYNLAGVSLPAEQTALRQVINGGVGALGNAMRAAFLVAGAPAIAVQKVLDEMVRAATQGVFGPFGIRPADMATTRAFSRFASERGLGVGDWLGDKSAVNRYLENGVSPPATILRDAQASGIVQGVRGVSPYGEKLSAGQRALALNPIAAANRAIDKFINITIQSPTQHIILNAANKAYIEQAGGMRNIVENVVDRFNRTPGIAATDLARYTDSLRVARSLGEFKAVMDDYTAHYGSLPDNRGFGGGNGIPSIGTNGTPDVPLPETPIGTNGHSPAPLPEQPAARPTRGAANGRTKPPSEMFVNLPQTEAEVPAYIDRIRTVVDALPVDQRDAVLNAYRQVLHKSGNNISAQALDVLTRGGLRAPYVSAIEDVVDNPLAREAQARQQLGRDYDPDGYSTPSTHIAPGTDVGASLRPFEAPQGAEAMGYDGGIGMPGPPQAAFPNPDVAAHNANRALIGQAGQDYAAAQRAVPQRANELATNIIGNPADQTNIGAALRNGWQVNGYSVLPAVLPFANFHIHTTQFWLRYFAEHPVMPVMIAKSLMNAGIDDYGYMPTDNGGAVGGATRMSTAAHLMDWGIKSWQYFSDLRRNPNGNSLLQQAEKNLAYNTIGNNAFIGAFPEETGLLSGIAQSTTNPLLGKRGATDPRDVLRERGSENWIEGGLNLAGVNRDWSHAIGGAGNTASNLGMSAGVNLANALGGDANLKAYNSTASLDFVARGLARQLGWDDNRTEFALADIKRNQNDPQTYPLGKDGQALMDAYRHQQDVAGLSKASPITYRPPDEKPIFPAENSQSFVNARGNAGTGGVPYNQDTRQYETALKQLSSKDFPTNDYGRDYLKTTGVFDQTNGGQPSEQRTTQAQQRQDAEILRASINTGTYLSPADRQKLQDYTNAEEAYKGLPAGTRGDLTVTELLSQPGNYYDTIRKAEAALQSGNKDLAQAYFDLADKLQTSQGKNVQDFFTTTATAGARDDIKRLNLRKDDALLNPDVQRGLAPLNRVGEAFRNPQTGEVIQPGQTFAPTARNQSSPTIKGERQYYDQWTQPQRDAYDAYLHLEGSDIAKHYFDLSHQIPDKATDPRGFSAWFKDNGTRYNEAANAYRQSLMDIRSRTGVNPLEVANEMHLTKGQNPLGSTTIPELRSQNPDVPKTNGNTGQPGSGTGAGSQKNPYGQSGKNPKTQPGKNAPVSEALSAAQALRDVYFALSKAEKSEVLKAVPNISRLVARGTNYTAEEYTQARTSLERALKGQGAGAITGLLPTHGYDRTGAPIRGQFTPTAATAQFVGNEVVSGANPTGRVNGAVSRVAASSRFSGSSTPTTQKSSGAAPSAKSTYPSIGVAGSPRAAAYTSNYGTSSNRKGR